MFTLAKTLRHAVVVAAAATAFTMQANADDVAWNVDYAGTVNLVDAAGRSFTNDNFEDKLTLVYFGYTTCLMQCPPTWITLDQVIEDLGDDADKVDAVFVSIDPARDTVEAIADWQENWPTITALTGTLDQIHAVADAFHIFFAKKPMHAMPFSMAEMKRIRERYSDDTRIKWDAARPENFYMMDHTPQIFLVGPEAQYLTHFEQEEDAATVLKVVRSYLEGGN